MKVSLDKCMKHRKIKVVMGLKICRSSHPEVLYLCDVYLYEGKYLLKNIAKFTGKYLCQILFLDKVTGYTVQLYLKKTLAQVLILLILQNFQESHFL